MPIKEECKPVQQKLRRMIPDVLLKIKEEVKKQFDAGFLQVVKYSEWVANIVTVPKRDGKVRMCVDYRDLNKASPKDNPIAPYRYLSGQHSRILTVLLHGWFFWVQPN
ncbi:uncharacterized protein LOC105793436 [Gossypium raimondii]|uniref:uncharacterized protein LOC105793436 n=1 Tax=Gossypium raimondii TaxID=29730 RepID=UPI00063AA977|nr:uncharacterized protein LOC105793436 [Gossypium raimondii]